MSRCLPFPPPGYTWNGVSGEALVELLKVKREKAEAERKREKRKRKKEKKQHSDLEEGEIKSEKQSDSGRHKHRKRKKGEKSSDNQGKGENETSGKHSKRKKGEKRSDNQGKRENETSGKHHKRKKGEKISDNQGKRENETSGEHRKRKKGEKRSDNQGKRENETQVLERSSVTEELEQPVANSLYDSSDNSRNSKRTKHNLSPNGCNNHGSIVSIDFQLQKHKDPGVLFREPGCSTTRTDLVVQEKFELAPSPIKEKFSSTYGGSTTTAQELAHSELHHFSSQRIEASTDEKAEKAMPSSFFESGLLQMEAQFKNLIMDWVPPPIQSTLSEFDDQEWLFERRQPRRDITERSDASSDDLSRGSSTLYPHARYLAQADIYALPFTIPF